MLFQAIMEGNMKVLSVSWAVTNGNLKCTTESSPLFLTCWNNVYLLKSKKNNLDKYNCHSKNFLHMIMNITRISATHETRFLKKICYCFGTNLKKWVIDYREYHELPSISKMYEFFWVLRGPPGPVVEG